jgi:hypothetical protein
MNGTMLAYRPALVSADPRPLTSELIEKVGSEVSASEHFLTVAPLKLHWSRVVEEPFWEVYHGRALDRSQTREHRRFESWWGSVEGGDRSEPLLAIRWDRDAGVIHVSRAIECRVREGYQSGPDVFDARDVTKWVRELVGTVSIAACRTAGRLRDELSGLMLDAVVGTSRLPLTSLESPLPAFTLGQLAYSYADATRDSADGDPYRWAERFRDPQLIPFERAKLLESLVRCTSADIDVLAKILLEIDPRIDSWTALVFAVFNSASLSPYTDFVPRILALVRQLTNAFPDQRADFLARLVLLIDRHLGAYDLVKFHHRGANYPDALLLEELWRDLLELIREHPHLFITDPAERGVRRRRRAVRHALLLRLEYAGHRVPDWPTSIGENARIMPPPFHPLSEEQIHAPQRRTRRLFELTPPDDAAIWSVLRDLSDPRELQELGTALFLHRPFRSAKQPGEPDRTPLVSHLLFSRSVAERRLAAVARFDHQKHDSNQWIAGLGELQVDGRPLRDAGGSPRPGIVSLHDAFLTADDWIALRTTRSSLRDLETAFAWPVDLAPARDWRLVIPDGHGLIALGNDLQCLCRVAVDLTNGYVCRGGVEVPTSGLVVSRESEDEVRVSPALAE